MLIKNLIAELQINIPVFEKVTTLGYSIDADGGDGDGCKIDVVITTLLQIAPVNSS